MTDGGQEFCAKNIGRYAGDIAQSKCQEFDADLPWPKTERENTDLRSLLVYFNQNGQDIDQAWLGITDDGHEGKWTAQPREWSDVLVGQAAKNEDGTITWTANGTGVARA